MGCLKCGANTAEAQVFCDACLDVMQKYPVNPETPVRIPHREPSVQERKTPVSQDLTSHHQIAQLRTMIRWLTATIGVLSVLLCLMAVLLLRTLDAEPASPAIGKNYTTDTRHLP